MLYFKKHSRLFLAFLVVFSLFLSTSDTLGKTIYVDQKNNNEKDGTEANPFSTINKALSEAKSGDKIYIKSGKYDEKIIVPRGVEIIGSGKDKVTIQSNNKTVSVVKLDHKTKIKGVTVSGGRVGIEVPKKAGVKIAKVGITETGKQGIFLDGDAKTRSNDRYVREISDISITDNGGKGIYAKKSRIELIDSKIENNEEEGVDIRKGVKALISKNNIKDNKEGNIEFKVDEVKLNIENNKIGGAGASGISAQSYQGTKGVVYITGNTIKKSTQYGVRCSVQNKNPRGGWVSKLFLSDNVFSSNKDGNFSKQCKLGS